LAIGYIFSTFIRRKPQEGYDPLKYFNRPSLWDDIKYSAAIAAPAIVLHELAHKFVAIAFGATATVHAPLEWYIPVIIMRLLNFPLFFFVGGYTQINSYLPPLQSAIVSLAGPLMNLILYVTCTLLVRYKVVHRKYYNMIAISGRLNLFLMIFNMIPFPGFDGFGVVSELYKIIKQIFL